MSEVIKKSGIVRIKTDEASAVIENRQPLGLFYTVEISKTGKSTYVGIDNTDGNAWTEDFKSLEECNEWLVGK